MPDAGMFYRHLGELIQRARKERKMSQDGLASAIHLKRTSISNIEKGRQKLLVHTLVEIADILNVDLAALLPAPRAPANIREDELQKYSEPERAWIQAGIRRSDQGETL
jgi:transcriptional regulator with XRE-family HTH domain